MKLNGQSLGTKEFETQTTGAGYTYQTVKGESKNHKSLYMTWEVPYREEHWKQSLMIKMVIRLKRRKAVRL
ncbi:MAG: hypothetical protein ACLVFI_05185 [Christensenellales bacterium]